MSENLSSWFMISLDSIMIIYTVWILSRATSNTLRVGIGLTLFSWLALLHVGLSTESLFPKSISGLGFLIIVFTVVAAVGLLLFAIPPIRKLIVGLNLEQLLLLQGIRVFFGATFLMQASIGELPADFGIVDGWTHIAAGFFGLAAAYSLAVGVNGIRRAWFANVFGIIDILVVASSISFVLLPELTPHHNMMYAVFLPAPLWLWMHLISIWKLSIPGRQERILPVHA